MEVDEVFTVRKKKNLIGIKPITPALAQLPKGGLIVTGPRRGTFNLKRGEKMKPITESKWIDVMFAEGPDDSPEPHFWPPAVYLWATEQGLNFPTEALKLYSVHWKKEIDEEEYTGRQKEALECAFKQSLKDLKDNAGKKDREIQLENIFKLMQSTQIKN